MQAVINRLSKLFTDSGCFSDFFYAGTGQFLQPTEVFEQVATTLGPYPGNTRWDLIDLVRTAYALRPDGINWPEEDGRVSLKLERLTAANGIDHGQAHDALADVRATLALARLVRDRQPKLYEFLYKQRSKSRVLEQIELLKPLLHISGRFAGARHYLAVVLPLAWHPRNRNALIVCDLHLDPAVLLELDSETLRQRLYTRRDELLADQLH